MRSYILLVAVTACLMGCTIPVRVTEEAAVADTLYVPLGPYNQNTWTTHVAAIKEQIASDKARVALDSDTTMGAIYLKDKRWLGDWLTWIGLNVTVVNRDANINTPLALTWRYDVHAGRWVLEED